MLDGTVKTMLVDDSQPVTNLMVVICTKIGTSHTPTAQTNKQTYLWFSFFLWERESKRQSKEKQWNPLKITRWLTLNLCLSRLSLGITNHDEYSLVRENQEEEAENKPNFGTLTLRRKKEEKEPRDQKMEQLKKKIKTDDEREWRRIYFVIFGFPFFFFFFSWFV